MGLSLSETVLLGLALLAAGGLWLIVHQPRWLAQCFGAAENLTAADRLAAEDRANQLLRQLLHPDEYERMMQRGYLEVSSPTIPGRSYRIPYPQGLVDVFDHGIATLRLCVVPTRWVPDHDLMIMHKLFIEGDEARYLRVANQFPAGTARLVSPMARKVDAFHQSDKRFVDEPVICND